MEQAQAQECGLKFIVRGKNNLILHQRHAVVEKEELKSINWKSNFIDGL